MSIQPPAVREQTCQQVVHDVREGLRRAFDEEVARLLMVPKVYSTEKNVFVNQEHSSPAHTAPEPDMNVPDFSLNALVEDQVQTTFSTNSLFECMFDSFGNPLSVDEFWYVSFQPGRGG